MKALPLLLFLAVSGFAQDFVDPGAPKAYPYRPYVDPVTAEIQAMRAELQQQADWAAIYQIYPNNPAFYRWLERNNRHMDYYLGR